VAVPETPKKAVAKPEPAAAVLAPKTLMARSIPLSALPAAVAPAVETVSATRADAASTSIPTAATTPKAEVVSQPPVTVTGCLEVSVDEDRFRLTDTDGANAPKARSWRSGFLKKRSTPVELVEVPDRSVLQKYVGHRVVATGLLTSRELRVQSLQSAGSSCD
jgi:hypothetical protein